MYSLSVRTGLCILLRMFHPLLLDATMTVSLFFLPHIYILYKIRVKTNETGKI